MVTILSAFAASLPAEGPPSSAALRISRVGGCGVPAETMAEGRQAQRLSKEYIPGNVIQVRWTDLPGCGSQTGHVYEATHSPVTQSWKKGWFSRCRGLSMTKREFWLFSQQWKSGIIKSKLMVSGGKPNRGCTYPDKHTGPNPGLFDHWKPRKCLTHSYPAT